MDLSALESCEMTAPYIPEPMNSYAHINSLPPAKPFKGDQSLFLEF